MHKKHCLALACSLALGGQLAHASSQSETKGFIEDASLDLLLRIAYFNRDYKDNTNDAKSWGQGFIATFESGFTQGTVGFGVDAFGLLGVKLDSGRGRNYRAFFDTDSEGRPVDDLSQAGGAVKLRVSNTVIKYGNQFPSLPVLGHDDSRLLPQVFEGGLLTSSELEGLTFTGGRLDKVIDRASTNEEDMVLNSKNRRFAGGVSADHLDLAGVDYKFAPGFTGRYYFADLDDIYRQHFLGLLSSHKVGAGTLSSDLRLIYSSDSGAAKAGKVDNRAINAMVSYGLGNHKVGLGFQDMSGDTGFAYIDGSDPFLINFVQINDFANADERSWQARYDYNFAGIGVPGLTFMTRYIRGDDARIAGSDERGGEWERDIEFKYVVQSGPLKDLYVSVRNASFRSDFARDADENRVIVGYTLPIW
ncbi:MAG TPA: outer membrane porin, OprD family [Pseudomonas sp.]|nr:outer membrane porin, OprD family [Pseudomonas sp.]